MNALAELSQSRDLLVNLTLRELRGKYKRSVLGWTWSLLNPLATMVIFTLVFGRAPQGRPPATSPERPPQLPGLPAVRPAALELPVGRAQRLDGPLLGNAGLIKKVYFPREILVVSPPCSPLTSRFVIEMGVLSVFLLILGNMVLPWLLPALLVMVLLTVFAAGIGLILSVLNVYFRDVQYLVGIVLQLWFYATPIIYPISRVQDRRIRRVDDRRSTQLNPMVGLRRRRSATCSTT